MTRTDPPLDYTQQELYAMAANALRYRLDTGEDTTAIAWFRFKDDAEEAAKALSASWDGLRVVEGVRWATPPGEITYATLREPSGVEWACRRTSVNAPSDRLYDVRRVGTPEGARSAKPGVVAFYAPSVAEAARQLGIEE